MDFTSLLLAVTLSGLCLSATMISVWTSVRRDTFLLTWAGAVLLLVGHVIAYWVYVQSPSFFALACLMVLLASGLAVLYGAAHQFSAGRSPLRRSLLASSAVIVPEVPLVLAGYDGAALVVENFGALAVLCMTAWVYFQNRSEAPTPMVAIAVMYAACGVSFGLCGLMVVLDGQWVIGYAPDNWAEDLNIAVAVGSMTGIGALSLGLSQSRNAARHRAAALSDPLTGAMNRRALFMRYGEKRFGPFMAIIMFDLDHFKKVNDTYGHAVGDLALRTFVDVARRHLRADDDFARLGGEEFGVVVARITKGQAQSLAEAICRDFAAVRLETDLGPLTCTASAGIGFGDAEGASLEEVMHRADMALYEAKRSGRNRIECTSFRLAG